MADNWERFYDKLYEEADSDAETTEDDAVADQDFGEYFLYNKLRLNTQRYQQESLIGKGGWKTIYRVHDARANRDVALARPRNNGSAEHYEIFLREAHITARLEHANIIKLFDMGVEEDGTPFFTMEFKRGQSLHERLRTARDKPSSFPLSERLQVFLAVCDAISYAHSRRVLHLDLKPENIQVGEYGEVQVCDWGLGEIAINSGDEATDSEALLDPDMYGNNCDPGLIKGTPGFMAPEQKKSAELHTYQTDVYALGKTLGVLIGPEAAPALQAIVAKATMEKPTDRYPSVIALQDDVQRFITLHPTSVEPGGALREAWLFVRRHQRSCIIAALGLIMTMSVSTMFLAELEVGRRSQAAAEAEALRAKSDLVYTEHEATRANNRAQQHERIAEALIAGNYQKAYDESVLIMDVLGSDPFYGQSSLKETIAVLNEAEERGKLSRVQVRQKLGYAHFVAQEFDKAAMYYEGLDADLDLQSLLPEYIKVKGDNDILTAKQFCGLIRKLGNKDKYPRLSLIEHMTVYYSSVKRRRIPSMLNYDMLQVALATLDVFNPKWSRYATNSFTIDQEAFHLELSGKTLTTLANRAAKNRPRVISLLQTLQLKSLTLRDTGVEDLSQIASLGLWQLELINTTPTSFEPLRDMTSLQILKVDTPELQHMARAQLDNNIKIELIDSPTQHDEHLGAQDLDK